MKPKIEIKDITARTVGVFVDGQERARYSGKDRQTLAEDWVKEWREANKPKGGFWDLKRGDKVVIQPLNGSAKKVGNVVGNSTEHFINTRDYYEKFSRKTGNSQKNTARIYINDAEVAELEAVEIKRKADEQAKMQADSLKREQERAADPRTPYLDNLSSVTGESHDWHKLTLDQCKILFGWLGETLKGSDGK